MNAVSRLHDITSANSVGVMTVADLFPNGFNLEQWATDASYAVADKTLVESRMGVDGHMAAGYVPSPTEVTLNFEASSPSRVYMAQIAEAMKANNRIYEITLVISTPSIGETVTYTGGVLNTAPPAISSGKVLNATAWGITFADYSVSRS